MEKTGLASETGSKKIKKGRRFGSWFSSSHKKNNPGAETEDKGGEGVVDRDEGSGSNFGTGASTPARV
jgi:hypothetical protein